MGRYVSGRYVFDDLEPLGRCCFDQRDARKNRAGTRFIRRALATGEMSVDELQQADRHHLSYIHDVEGSVRSQPQRFHGWYVFSVEAAVSASSFVRHEPTLSNPWHAMVILQDPTGDDDALVALAAKIAADTEWQDLPLRSSDEEFLNQVTQGLE